MSETTPDEVPNPEVKPKTLTELRNEMLQIGGALAMNEQNIEYFDTMLSDIMTKLNETRGEVHNLKHAFATAVDTYNAAVAAGLK